MLKCTPTGTALRPDAPHTLACCLCSAPAPQPRRLCHPEESMSTGPGQAPSTTEGSGLQAGLGGCPPRPDAAARQTHGSSEMVTIPQTLSAQKCPLIRSSTSNSGRSTPSSRPASSLLRKPSWSSGRTQSSSRTTEHPTLVFSTTKSIFSCLPHFSCYCGPSIPAEYQIKQLTATISTTITTTTTVKLVTT